jgi:hypothetical protein
MLSGKKPLAMFADGEGRFPEAVVRYLKLFDRHVSAGRMIRRDHKALAGSYVLHRILFAIPGEEWRIDAMIELKQSREWSRDHERREGELLGYEDWMNDYHLARAYPL